MRILAYVGIGLMYPLAVVCYVLSLAWLAFLRLLEVTGLLCLLFEYVNGGLPPPRGGHPLVQTRTRVSESFLFPL